MSCRLVCKAARHAVFANKPEQQENPIRVSLIRSRRKRLAQVDMPRRRGEAPRPPHMATTTITRTLR